MIYLKKFEIDELYKNTNIITLNIKKPLLNTLFLQ